MDSVDPDLPLSSFLPRPATRLPDRTPAAPRFPVIDAHNHLGSAFGDFAGDWPRRPVAELVEEMDRAGVRTIVDLDGQWGDMLRAELARYQEPYPERFAVFAGIDDDNVAVDRRFGETEARRLRESAAMGARGLKIWKPLGLRLRDADGRLVAVDDRRLDPLWATAGELRLPVMIHIADPVAFFQPLDRFNERWEQLRRHPDWHFYPTRPPGALDHPGFPSFAELMAQFATLLRRHPATTFIGAHVGCNAEDLDWVGTMLDACPNFYVDIAARLAELGRKPYSTRDFVLRFADRVLFGTDAPANVRTYRLHYRFLETRDEYFDYDLRQPPPSGRWQIYGLDLPEDVLRRVYHDNAARLLRLDG